MGVSMHFQTFYAEETLPRKILPYKEKNLCQEVASKKDKKICKTQSSKSLFDASHDEKTLPNFPVA